MAQYNAYYNYDDSGTYPQSSANSWRSHSSKQRGRGRGSNLNRPSLNNSWRQNPPQNNRSKYNFNENCIRNDHPKSGKILHDDKTLYAINLQLKPVEMGIFARNDQRVHEFKGLGAFNRYFGLLLPARGLGYTIPDIWDGHFHITLANFKTQMSIEQLEKTFRTFTPCLNNPSPIQDTLFRASSIKIFSGQSRTRDRSGIDFVVLPIDSTPEIKSFYEKLHPLLDEIKDTAKCEEPFAPRLVDDLHVTIRKYSGIDAETIEGIPISEFPLEFRCSRLEIKQTREQAVDRHKKSNGKYRWWHGVTEIDGKCSGCQTSISTKTWEGFCFKCGQYESIMPIWSTDGIKVLDDSEIR